MAPAPPPTTTRRVVVARLAWPEGTRPLDAFALSDAALHVEAVERVSVLDLGAEVVDAALVEATGYVPGRG